MSVYQRSTIWGLNPIRAQRSNWMENSNNVGDVASGDTNGPAGAIGLARRKRRVATVKKWPATRTGLARRQQIQHRSKLSDLDSSGGGEENGEGNNTGNEGIIVTSIQDNRQKMAMPPKSRSMQPVVKVSQGSLGRRLPQIKDPQQSKRMRTFSAPRKGLQWIQLDEQTFLEYQPPVTKKAKWSQAGNNGNHGGINKNRNKSNGFMGADEDEDLPSKRLHYREKASTCPVAPDLPEIGERFRFRGFISAGTPSGGQLGDFYLGGQPGKLWSKLDDDWELL